MKGVVDRFLGVFQRSSLQDRHEAGSEAEDLTLRLPDELLEKIFCHLGYQQVSQAAGVCRRWGAVVISMTNRFTYVLEDKLESEKARLSVIRTKMLVPERATHPQLLVDVAWKELGKVCSTLPDGVLYRLPSALRDRPKRDRPKFFSSIVGIAIINRRIAMAKAIPAQGEQRRVFCEISKQLAAMGAIAAARKFTTDVPSDDPNISSVISEIVKRLMSRGEIDRVQAIASTILCGELRANYFCEISKGFVAKGEIKRAQVFAKRALSIAGPALFGSKISPTALCKICEQFTVMGDIRGALKVADRALKTLGNEMDQGKYFKGLYEVCKQLAKMGAFSKAWEVVHKIQHPQYKFEAIISICSELIAMELLEDAMGAFDKAQEAVNGVPFLWVQSRALFKISRQLQAIGKLKEAAEVAEKARACMDGAEEQAKAMPDESLDKSFFFREICRQWVAMGEIERALAIANAVPHAWVRSEAFLAIP